MLSGSPDHDASKLADIFNLRNLRTITHVCERSNLALEVKRCGSLTDVLEAEMKNFDSGKMVIFTNSAAKATKISEQLEKKGERVFQKKKKIKK